ncbi:MAG TPA: BadF/BadG/BcrA/BcrD ATPase family protein, partial [Nocardioidaceae bacterium]|nr:BadF/BadG/BcrA/BcrD ATPase family protein [Nocardioidaceae bacterium]
MQPAVIGIDVGGSKTHGVRVATDARLGDTLVSEATVGSANIVSVGVETAAARLGELAEALGADVDAVCVGAAGADTPQARDLLLSMARRVFPTGRVRVVHDTYLVLAAAGLRAGAVGISGTGSAAWGRNPAGDEARAGGWGYLLGDEGSAYGVVRAAMRHVLNRTDDGQELDQLSRELMRSCGATDVHDLLDEFYRAPSRRTWAARAPLVLELATSGEAAAMA